MKGLAIREVWESFDRKYNPSDDKKGRAIASREFSSKLMSLIESKKLRWNDVSFKDLWENLVVSQDLEEAYDSSAMPIILAQLISKKIIDAYEAYPQQGLKLVEVVPSSLREEVVVGWTAVGTLSEVKENDLYEEAIPPDEKYVRIIHKKYGKLLSVTEETIKFDQTQQFLKRASSIGERGAQFLDKTIMRGILDRDTNVYNKGSLYAAASSTGGTYGNAWTGADTALGSAGWEKAQYTLHERTDEQSEPIWVAGDRPQMVVSPRQVPTAMKLRNGEYGNIGTANLDVNVAQNMFDIVESVYFASLTTNTSWLYGSFKRQFQWDEIFPLQVLSRSGQDTEDGFKRDVVQQFKVRLYGGIGATDYRYVNQMAGA